MSPVRTRRARLLTPFGNEPFPDPAQADNDGLVAIGADLSAERLLDAYDRGIFPWYGEGLPVLWWSPNPRGVLRPECIHVSRSMRREIMHAEFQLTWNAAFDRVLDACASERTEGTWLSQEMQAAYCQLHRMGHAYSLEVWHHDQLIGGVYGVQRGRLFAAESMFHRRANASKLALIALAQTLGDAGVRLIDVQFVTSHLATLGAETITRDAYLRQLSELRSEPCELEQMPPRLSP